jgi:oligoribonuclease NrnB/cAMP/cGMP phosphodiesterase (DHH superfamily)
MLYNCTSADTETYLRKYNNCYVKNHTFKTKLLYDYMKILIPDICCGHQNILSPLQLSVLSTSTWWSEMWQLNNHNFRFSLAYVQMIKVFNDKNCSLLQVIYRCTSTLRLWLSLQRVENRDLFMEVCARLEATARDTFSQHGWLHSLRIGAPST